MNKFSDKILFFFKTVKTTHVAVFQILNECSAKVPLTLIKYHIKHE